MPIELAKFQLLTNPPKDVVFINPFYITRVEAGGATARGETTNIYLAEPPTSNPKVVIVLAPVEEVVRQLKG
jgi:hypothetical protein